MAMNNNGYDYTQKIRLDCHSNFFFVQSETAYDCRKWVESVSKYLVDHYKICLLRANTIGIDNSNISFDDIAFSENHFDQLSPKQSNITELEFSFLQYDIVFVHGTHQESKNLISLEDTSDCSFLRLRETPLRSLVRPRNQQNNSEVSGKFYDSTYSKVLTFNSAKHAAKLLVEHFKAPPLYGLLLSGGGSKRMKKDKGEIHYHGKTQRAWGYELLTRHCERVFHSIQKVQDVLISEECIIDFVEGIGPLGGIASAFMTYPHAAFLVMACDLPLMKGKNLYHLINDRAPGKAATAYINKDTKLPEPLFAIWEPKIHAKVLDSLDSGYRSPTKILLNDSIKLLESEDTSFLFNANTPLESKFAFEKIGR